MQSEVNQGKYQFSVVQEHGITSVTMGLNSELETRSAFDFQKRTASLVGEVTCTALVIDIENVGYLDSMGLGALVHACKEGESKEKPVIIYIGPDNQRIYKLFEITGLNKVLPIITDRPPAPAAG